MTAETTAHHSLLGASVLVAGPTGGLGQAMAAELSTRGATLTLVGRDARRLAHVLAPLPPHTETGLAGRALEGRAPALAVGLSPASVAAVVGDALERGATDLPSGEFATEAA